ncbi:hypothetical protein NECAME_18742, partial [Necator americanus]
MKSRSEERKEKKVLVIVYGLARSCPLFFSSSYHSFLSYYKFKAEEKEKERTKQREKREREERERDRTTDRERLSKSPKMPITT